LCFHNLCTIVLEKEFILDKANELYKLLKDAGIRCDIDSREIYNPGWKYNYWEMKGVPLRIELGPNDYDKKQIMIVRRDTGEKKPVAWDKLMATVPKLLDEIQQNLYNKAKEELNSHLVKTDKWEEFLNALDNKNIVLSPWCGQTECEENIKIKSGEAAKSNFQSTSFETSGGGKAEKMTGGAKSLCLPFEHNKEKPKKGTVCVCCRKAAAHYCLFGRSY